MVAMPLRNEYRRKAESCLLLAEELRDPVERLKLLEIAGGYLVLDRHVEHHDRGLADRNIVERDRERLLDDVCPNCGATMELVRVLPKLGSDPELHTFQCAACKYVATYEADGPI